MSYQFDVAGVARLEAYFAQFGSFLKDKRKRESFAMYAFGILGEGERKSAEPIAARAATSASCSTPMTSSSTSSGGRAGTTTRCGGWPQGTLSRR